MNLFTLRKTASKSTKTPNPNKGRVKDMFQKFARALLGPITLLAFAGLFLGIGAVIAKYTEVGTAGNTIAIVIKNIGNIVFTLLPLLFAMAVASAFTDNNGTAILSAVIAYVAIIALSGAQFTAYQHGTKTGFSWFGVIDFETKNGQAIVSKALGFQTLEFSVFGGFIAGPIAVFCYKKFKDTRMPIFLQMFQGERTVPIMAIILGLPISLVLALIWPWVSQVFVLFGEASGKIGGGSDSLLFGVFERGLLPTGLHHMFYSPLLYSQAGATVSGAYHVAGTVVIDGHKFLAGTALYQIDATPFFNSSDLLKYTDALPKVEGFQMSQADWTNALAAKDVHVLTGDRTAFQTINGSALQFSWINELQGGHSVHLGRFSAGKFPLMVFFIPAGGFAMIMAAPKQNRKLVTGVVGAAALTSFLTGITEPFEYTFLFAAPVLFFGFHIWMAGLSYMLANLAGVYYGPTFGGVIDYVIYGIVPQIAGQVTNFYWLLAIGAGGSIIYYFVFYWAIKKFNLPTPGRDGKEVAMVTKADYKASKGTIDSKSLGKAANSKGKKDPMEIKAQIMYAALGGKDNLTSITNCASRLRVSVKDPKIVNYDLAQQAQPFGVVGKGKTAQQYVFGPSVVLITTKVKELAQGKLAVSNEFVNSPKSKIVSKTKALTKVAKINVLSPTKGKIKPLSKISDEVFKKGMMGEGIAVTPTDGKYYAPISGEVTMLFPSLHAYGITNEDGVAVLVHIGLDTVKLDGEGFKAHIKQGDRVKAGDLMIEVDMKKVAPKVKSMDTPVVVTPDSNGKLKIVKSTGPVTTKTKVFEISQ